MNSSGTDLESDTPTLSVQEADQFLHQLRNLVRENNENEFAIAEGLYRLWADSRHIERWGHRTWVSWAERELKILPTKAYTLRQLHEWFAVKQPLSDLLFARVRRMGWSKASLLIKVMTVENAAALLADIEDLTKEELGTYLRRRREKAQQARILRANAVRDDASPAASIEVPVSENTIDESVADESVADESIADGMSAGEPMRRERRRIVFDLFEDQIETYDCALKRSMELSNSKKIGHNLSLICLDFLATNDFKFGDETERLRFLAKFEKLTGYRLIIIDPKADKVVYGIKTLETHAQSAYGDDDRSEAP